VQDHESTQSDAFYSIDYAETRREMIQEPPEIKIEDRMQEQPIE
jgi:hypothetical protein